MTIPRHRLTSVPGNGRLVPSRRCATILLLLAGTGLACGFLPGECAAQRPVFPNSADWFSEDTFSTESVALGDVDLDGDLDLVCGAYGDNNSLYINDNGLNTDAVWTDENTFSTNCVALGDLNGDGYPDLVYGNEIGESNLVFLNDGGRFRSTPSWSGDQNGDCRAVALGDVNGDGLLDVVFGNRGQGNTIFLNTGAEELLPQTPNQTIATGNDATFGVALADVDRNGFVDLICGNDMQRNELFLNVEGALGETPVWTSSAINATYGIAVGDIDGDGWMDLVCGNASIFPNTIYRNESGAGNPNVFASSASLFSPEYNEGTHSVALGDLDGDGDLDIVFGNAGTDQRNRVYRNDDGTLFPVDALWADISDLAHSVALGDISGDGFLDLVCGNYGNWDTAYFGISDFFTSGLEFSTDDLDTYSALLVDMNDDGVLDLVCGNDAAENGIYLGDGDSFSAAPDWSSGTGSSTYAVAVGDLDADGLPDLVCGNDGEPCRAYRNSGDALILDDTPFWITDDAHEVRSLAIGDIDGDGNADIACGVEGDSNLVYFNTEGSLSTAPDWKSGNDSDTRSIALVDIDGDRDLDLVCGNSNSVNSKRTNTVYRNDNGTLPQDPESVSAALGETTAIALGDLNGDTTADLICGNSGQRNTYYRNDGTAFVDAEWATDPTDYTTSVKLADLDMDGDLDVACGSRQITEYHQLYVNRLDAGGNLDTEQSRSLLAANLTYSIDLGDVDDDGDLDLLCGNHGINALYPGLNTPPYRGDLSLPSHQLPNNSAFLRSVRVDSTGYNLYRITGSALDVEGDELWIVVDYQFRGVPAWYPATLDGGTNRVGPLASAPGGVDFGIDWSVTEIPFDPRDVVLRLRAISMPQQSGLVQNVATYIEEVGQIEIQRPEITLSRGEFTFPPTTVGSVRDTTITIANTGNEMLRIEAISPPPEVTVDLSVPFDIAVGRDTTMTISIQPMSGADILAPVTITSNDVINATTEIDIATDALPLDVEVRLLAPAEIVPLGEALTVIVTPEHLVEVEGGTLYHRPGNSSVFDEVDLTESGADFIAIVPGAAVTEDSVYYYVVVENGNASAPVPSGAPGVTYVQPVEPPAGIDTDAIPTSGSGTDYVEERSIRMELDMRDATFVSGTLHYRLGGRTEYIDTGFAWDAETSKPVATIPDSLVGPRGLEYWVDVTTSTSQMTDPLFPSPGLAPYSIPVTIQDLEEEAVYPGGHYRMVTIPLLFPDAFTGMLDELISSQDEFGNYDPINWRAFRYLNGLGENVELSEDWAAEFRPEPGRVFWLISRLDSRITTAPIPGVSTPTTTAWPIVLHPGWNQIGNPYCFPVAWADAVVDGSSVPDATVQGDLGPLFFYDSDEQYQGDTEILEVFGGYFVQSFFDDDVILRIPAVEYVAEPESTSTEPGEEKENEGWRIAIEASAGDLVDAWNLVGVSADADDERDPLDTGEPPPSPGPGLVVYFPHSTWAKHPGRYTTDFRKATAGAGGHVWRFDVARRADDSDDDNRVTLAFTGLASVPPAVQLFLVDHFLERQVDLRETPAYSFILGPKDFVADEERTRFSLLAGSEAFIESGLEYSAVPHHTALLPNCPNPFNPSTIIRYHVAGDCRVTLRIYDLCGALVRTLVDEATDAGRYERAWYGRDDAGRRVASGVYFSRLRTSAGHAETRKLLLVK